LVFDFEVLTKARAFTVGYALGLKSAISDRRKHGGAGDSQGSNYICVLLRIIATTERHKFHSREDFAAALGVEDAGTACWIT
jgi:hypothetical protein